MQKFKIALITIEIIADLLKTLVALKNAVKKKIRAVFVSPVSSINARMNRNRKMWCFILSRNVEISTQKEKIYHVNKFYWMIVKLRMYAT